MIKTILNPKLYHDDFDLKGYSFWGGNIGIKDNTPDFGLIFSQVPAIADAVFTKNRYPGAPIIIGKKHIQGGLQSIVVNSKNANAYTGKLGEKNAYTMCKWASKALGITPQMVLPSSTGVIGKHLDMKVIRRGFKDIPNCLLSGRKGLELFANAIMTSDAYPKWGVIKVYGSTILGVVKGAGMIEPNMATMLAYFLTDADIPLATLHKIFREVVNNSFNAITVDGDTSTSDTAVIMANRMAGKENTGKYLKQFKKSLGELATYLAQLIVADGEGARKIIELHVTKSQSRPLAEAIAKSVLNSSLVKTAVYGEDPNWGRIIMAIGKVEKSWRFDVNKVKVYSISNEGRKKILLNRLRRIHHSAQEERVNTELKRNFSEKKVILEISLGNGKISKTFWGSDLGVDYVKYNSDYTT